MDMGKPQLQEDVTSDVTHVIHFKMSTLEANREDFLFQYAASLPEVQNFCNITCSLSDLFSKLKEGTLAVSNPAHSRVLELKDL